MKVTDVEHRVVDIDATRAYPSVTVLGDGSILAMYHEHDDNGERPLQYVASTRFRLAD